jgi:hypothetical protein
VEGAKGGGFVEGSEVVGAVVVGPVPTDEAATVGWRLGGTGSPGGNLLKSPEMP